LALKASVEHALRLHERIVLLAMKQRAMGEACCQCTRPCVRKHTDSLE
jgi:hypothetical protein